MIVPPKVMCEECRERPTAGCYAGSKRVCKECWEKLTPAWWRKAYGY